MNAVHQLLYGSTILLTTHQLLAQTVDEINQLTPINVIAQPEHSVQRFSQDQIKSLPKSNQTINGLLAQTSAVRYGNTVGQSSKGGEIEPELVSFYGEPYYNNLFLIDGLSNNNIMNPGSSNGGYKSAGDFEQPTSMYLAPGAPESFQVDTALVKSVNVYENNIPAKYSGFTGGVVNAELQEADVSKSSGRISYRTTRDSWTKFHLTEAQQQDFAENDATKNVQPKFVKHSYHLSINQPINTNTALLFAYNRTQSKMPEKHLSLHQEQTERRLAETLLLKASHHLSDNHKLHTSVMYSPHKSTYYADNVKNGRYQSTGGGWRVNINSDWFLGWGIMKSTIDYADMRNQIRYDSGSHYYNWVGNIPNSRLNWCSLYNKNQCLWAREGGLGELNSQTKSWTVKQDFETLPFYKFGDLTHRLLFGWSVNFTQATSQRPDAIRYFSVSQPIAAKLRSKKLAVPKNCIDCIENEQYLTNELRYPAYHANVNLYNHSLYFQDEMEWKRLKLNPGINISYDSFLNNVNIAPRFSFNIDLLGDKQWQVLGGINRYYAGNMLAYALRSTIPANQKGTRENALSNWQYDIAKNSIQWKNVRDLATPYSDELNIGFQYQLAQNHRLDSKYVQRSGKKQFIPQKDEQGVRLMSNDGKSHSYNISLGLQNISPYEAGIWSLSYQLGASYQKTKTRHHGNYDESLVDEITTAKTPYYLYENKRYQSVSELPPFNFNTPWKAFLVLNTDLPKYHFKWTHHLSYQAGYKHYTRNKVSRCRESSQPQACGDWNGEVYDYHKIRYRNAFMLDWNFLFTLPIQSKQLELSLDVINVLNQKIATSDANSNRLGSNETVSKTAYRLGRQFWLGVAYQW